MYQKMMNGSREVTLIDSTILPKYKVIFYKYITSIIQLECKRVQFHHEVACRDSIFLYDARALSWPNLTMQ